MISKHEQHKLENLGTLEEAEQIIEKRKEAKKEALKTALQVSQAKKSSTYRLDTRAERRGYYFMWEGIPVPFRVLFDDNNKTDGILGFSFGTAKDCPSNSLGLCQLPSDRVCYAKAGESRATKKNNEDGSRGMDSYFKGVLFSQFWDLFETHTDQVRSDLIRFLDENGIEELRFNLKGDFRHSLDICAVWHLAELGYRLTGYTARDDMSELLEKLGEHPRIILNGSNRKYTNRFKATTNIKEYLQASHRCIGSCSDCRNCYRLRGVEIVVLVHGSGSDTLLNTPENRKLIIDTFRGGVSIFKEEDFQRAKGLLTCVNKTLEAIGFNGVSFDSRKELLDFIAGRI